jgi:hypothetical protein
MISRIVAICIISHALSTAGLTSPAADDDRSLRLGTGQQPVEIQMRNVNFRLAQDIVLEVRTLRGRLQRTKSDVPVTFDKTDSFTVEIDKAQVAVSVASLTALMNSYVLAYEGAPIKRLTLQFHGDRLLQRGIIHKGVDIPFEIDGSLHDRYWRYSSTC